MGKSKDLTGQKFNRLTVIKKLDYKHPRGGFIWLCECDCGNRIKVPTYRITSGDIPSCGCQKRDGLRKKRTSRPRISFEKFVSKFDSGYTFYCEDWQGVVASVIEIECLVHGKFERKADQLRQVDIPCIQCAIVQRNKNKTNTYGDVVKKFKVMHGDKYTYPKSNTMIYENQNSTIEIICPEHGTFEKKVQKHLGGQGCFECRIKELIRDKSLIGGYSNRVFEDNPEIANAKGIIYYFKIGDFYKIGITRKDIRERIKALKSSSQLPVKVIDYKEIKLIEAYELEQNILSLYDHYRVRTDWSTELFNCNVLGGEIK